MIKKLTEEEKSDLKAIAEKVNEIIDKLNKIQPNVYIGPQPNAYDLHAVRKRIDRKL